MKDADGHITIRARDAVVAGAIVASVAIGRGYGGSGDLADAMGVSASNDGCPDGGTQKSEKTTEHPAENAGYS